MKRCLNCNQPRKEHGEQMCCPVEVPSYWQPLLVTQADYMRRGRELWDLEHS